MTVIGYIPARLGSERVARKNLRLLNGTPLLTRAIKTIKSARSLDQCFVNTESAEIANLAKANNIDVYIRDAELANNTTKTDDIVADFVQNIPCDIVVLVNPTAPFLKPQTIDDLVQALQSSESAVGAFTTDSIKRHALFNQTPINFDKNNKSPRTQDLTPIELVNFVVCAFKVLPAMQHYAKHGHFLYQGPILTLPMNTNEAFDIDTEDEFAYAEFKLQRAEEIVD